MGNRMRSMFATGGSLLIGALLLTGCQSPGTGNEASEAEFQAMLKSSFREEGIAGLDRLQQTPEQAACSSRTPPDPTLHAELEAQALATVKPPSDGQYLGDWREGEKLAQNGRGMTWSDKSTATSANGASCYNCHQIGPGEISFGSIGPSLYHYGKLRGVSDPKDPAAAPIVQYTWAKLYNAWAYNACSNMPRFGHKNLLDEGQLKNVMALLLDPQSPVNAK